MSHPHHMLCSVNSTIQHIWAIPLHRSHLILSCFIRFILSFQFFLAFFLFLHIKLYSFYRVCGIWQKRMKKKKMYEVFPIRPTHTHTHKREKNMVKHSIVRMTIKLEYRSCIDIIEVKKTNQPLDIFIVKPTVGWCCKEKRGGQR